jgi:hypothetical protein
MTNYLSAEYFIHPHFVKLNPEIIRFFVGRGGKYSIEPRFYGLDHLSDKSMLWDLVNKDYTGIEQSIAITTDDYVTYYMPDDSSFSRKLMSYTETQLLKLIKLKAFL